MHPAALSIKQALPSSGTSLEEVAHLLASGTKQLDKANVLRLHANLCTIGMESLSLGNHLICNLVESGLHDTAEQVFNKLVYQNDLSVNALITSYIKCSKPHLVINLYRKLKSQSSVNVNRKSSLLLLKALTQTNEMNMLSELHMDIARTELLEKDVVVSSTLVSMYAKMGCISKCEQVFNELQIKNAVVWTTLMKGYAANGFCKEAVKCYERMKHEGTFPDAVTLSCILKAFASTDATLKIQMVHVEIERQSMLEKDILLANTLIDSYAKCGLFQRAHDVFEKITCQDAVSWTALIGGYSEHGYGVDALKCYEQMQLDCVLPDGATFVCILKACGCVHDIKRGHIIHDKIEREGLLERDLSVGNSLVDMYVKCSLFASAWDVFNRIQVRDAVTWNSLISGYVEHESNEKAIEVFERMGLSGIPATVSTFVCVLKACAAEKMKEKGQSIHIIVEKLGLRETDLVLGNALIDMYAKCGFLVAVQKMFDMLPNQNVVSWTTLITGYAGHGHADKAIRCFQHMHSKGFSPNHVTFTSILEACGSIGAIEIGYEVHSCVEKQGCLVENPVLRTSLINMYAKCRELPSAHHVFDKQTVWNKVSWNALITGYVEQGYAEAAFRCFKQMQEDGVAPDAVTFICLLNACSQLRNIWKGREIHCEIERHGLLKRYNVGNSLVNMYVKCGSLYLAQQIFDNLPVLDVVSWTTLIAGYCEYGFDINALELYEQMKSVGVHPNRVTFLCALKACCNMCALEKGQELHGDIELNGLLEGDGVLGNTLVEMYSKCGLLNKAQEVFDKLPIRETVTWTSIMSGYANAGKSETVFSVFDEMINEGVKPDLLTFTVVLNACSRISLFNKSQIYFKTMSTDYDMIPTSEHHGCIIDLLAREGHVDKAVLMINRLPFGSNLDSWNTILSACRNLGNIDLGKKAFSQALCLVGRDTSHKLLYI